MYLQNFKQDQSGEERSEMPHQGSVLNGSDTLGDDPQDAVKDHRDQHSYESQSEDTHAEMDSGTSFSIQAFSPVFAEAAPVSQ